MGIDSDSASQRVAIDRISCVATTICSCSCTWGDVEPSINHESVEILNSIDINKFGEEIH
jgi:hypothetical protein